MIKTYESFISNIFTRRKKLPPEVLNLADKLVEFINSIIIDNYTWDASRYIYQPKNKKHFDIVSVFVDPHDMGSNLNFIQLYYNGETKSIMFAILQNSVDNLVSIRDFLDQILNGKYYKISETPLTDTRYWIKLSKIDDIIKELTLENYDLYINANKYNL